MASGRVKLLQLEPSVKEAAEWAVAWADYYQLPVTITSGFRSWSSQAKLRKRYEKCVATGRFGNTPECKFPANRPGDSAHNFGFAWDSTVPEWAIPWWSHVRSLAGFHIPTHDWIHAEVPNWRGYV